MRAALLVFVLLFVSAGVAAAQAPPQPQPFPGSEPDKSILDGSAQRKLDHARKRWRRAGIHNYRFQLTRQCFCPPDEPGPVRPRRQAGRADRRRKSVATVRRLHRRIQDAIDDRVSGISVRYDKRGMPRSIGLDPIGNAIDDEVGYKVEKFWRGTHGAVGRTSRISRRCRRSSPSPTPSRTRSPRLPCGS